jgi:hypothetical protein
MTADHGIRAGRIVDAQLHLLDRQVLDSEGVPVTAVDDLELSDVPMDAVLKRGTPAPVIENLLAGPVLATRIFSGRPPSSRWHRIPWSVITELGVAVRLGVPGNDLDVTWTERWISEHVIGRIPGGRNDPE